MNTSVAFWKDAVNQQDNAEDARLILVEATEAIPSSAELWIALARLETTHQQAKKVLNKARLEIPTSYEIWVAALKLQERMGDTNQVDIMRRAASAMIKREEWIREAETSEGEGAILTCNAIIMGTLGYGLDEDNDRKELWMHDARTSIARGKYETARAIAAYALRILANRESVWVAAAELEKHQGSNEALWQLLEDGVCCQGMSSG
ncbi:hypothetical protein MMC22_006398 [Lobaria immixta]|nr:hypothetical protein [Lobaria immixta]